MQVGIESEYPRVKRRRKAQAEAATSQPSKIWIILRDFVRGIPSSERIKSWGSVVQLQPESSWSTIEDEEDAFDSVGSKFASGLGPAFLFGRARFDEIMGCWAGCDRWKTVSTLDGRVSARLL
ncbi:hypothetical protein CRG98_002649 [Punica granatum]|uniref:Uncharacterized protein n=1 Tax=Punica granatum TaxID=22663 RepID=A0A2I0LAF2_PUNGR|nr:hypothetical protein CRG98_002649 [Punica granatum]